MAERIFFPLLLAATLALNTSSLKAQAPPPIVSAVSTAETTDEIFFEDFKALENYTYNFGYWLAGTTTYMDLYFTNHSAWPLKLQGIYIAGLSFNAVHRCPEKLEAGYRCMIRTYFQPWDADFHDGQFVVVTDRGQISVSLTGWGY